MSRVKKNGASTDIQDFCTTGSLLGRSSHETISPETASPDMTSPDTLSHRVSRGERIEKIDTMIPMIEKDPSIRVMQIRGDEK